VTELGGDAYRVLFEASARPMFVFDPATLRIVLANDAASKLYGWSCAELREMTLYDLRPRSEYQAFEASFAAAKANRTYPRAGRHWKKTGELMDVDLEITRVRIDGKPLSLVTITDVTGIADAERRFRLLVEHSVEGIALTGEDRRILYMSPGGERILGYPSGALVGVAWKELRPDDAPHWTLPRPGETSSYVTQLRRGDGSWCWIETTVTNLFLDPVVRALVSNFRDITARKRDEQVAIDAQQRLEYLISATSAITYTIRAQGAMEATFISSNVHEVLGYTPQQFLNDPQFWQSHLHDEDRVRIFAEQASLLATGEANIDYRFRHADGSYRWIRDAARVVRDKAGQPVEIVGHWVDISDQVRAVDAIKRSEANFRALIERLPSAVFVHREDRVMVYANPAAAALVGYDSPDDLVGRPVLDLVPPDDRELVSRRMTETLETGAAPPREGRLVRRDGSFVMSEIEAMLLDFDGKPCTVAIGRDVSERRELFARMALADRMLTVGTLAAGVAHEINNPLAYVAGNLELLASELPNLLTKTPSRLTCDDIPGLVADARDGVTRVSAIVRDLRALSRADDEPLGPVDVTAVLASSIKMANNEIRHRARVVQGYDPGLPLVRAHASRLGQVFLNLLLNAAQAIPEGRFEENEIRIRAGSSADRRRVLIEIEDTGVGIPAHLTRRIFDPFFTTKAPGVGIGLGLSISHEIVRAMDGEIHVESAPGRGSTFAVTLPAAPPRATQLTPPPLPTTRPSGRILLVDDEAAVGRSLAALLAPENEVIAVTRAQEALDRIGSGEAFDAILCDLMMPDINGIELYERVDSDARRRMIFMTGGAFTPKARQFLAKLDRPYLEKPFTEADLRKAIERLR
jgi:PAS domain S-box-containing protein